MQKRIVAKCFLAMLVLGVVTLGVQSSFARSLNFGLRPGIPNAQPAGQTPQRLPGVVYIQFKTFVPNISGFLSIDDPLTSEMKRVFEALGVTKIVPFDLQASRDAISHSLGIDRMYVIYYKNPIAPLAAIAMISRTGDVESASPRYNFKSNYTPNDPLVSSQWALTNIHAFEAWNIVKGDSSIVIADCDEGTNYNHEDLKGAIKINYGEVGLDKNGHDKRTNGIDDDSDGAVDNWHGWDVAGLGLTGLLEPDNDPIPDSSAYAHGTQTAGCIAATANNNLGVAGLGFGCKILPIKIADYYGQLPGGYEGIHYATLHGARVVNCSWGGPVDLQSAQFESAIIQEAVLHNVLVVTSSGNFTINIDSNIFFPADINGVLCVGATDQADAPASFSDYGHSVHVYAPGVGIATTDWPGNTSYGAPGGTSFSSPITAGLVGLVMSQHPDWPIRFVSRQIIETCDNVVKPSDRYNYWGRINAFSAVKTPAHPGLIIAKYAIDGTDSAALGDTVALHALRVTFKNVVADGTNLTAKIIPTLAYTTASGTQSLGNMAVGSGKAADFSIKRTSLFSSGSLAVYVVLTDGATYSDTEFFYIPLTPIAGFKLESSAQYGTGIKQITPSAGVACYGLEQTGTIYSGFSYEQSSDVWLKPTVVVHDSEALYTVDAVDLNHVWMGSGPASTSAPKAAIFYSVDKGANWQMDVVSTITPFVDGIHFFDAQNGFFLGDPIGTRWGFGFTTDGGATWKPNSKVTNSLSSEAGWNNSMDWVGDYGWFGTNKKHIYRTADRGVTWKGVSVPLQNCFGVGFASDSLHGLATFRPAAQSGSTTVLGTYGMMGSTDGGVSWTLIPIIDTTFYPGDVKFIPGTNIGFLCSNKGMFRSDNFGQSWRQIGIPTGWSSDGGSMSIARQGQTFTVSVINQTYGIASYTDQLLEGSVSTSAQASGLVLRQNFPNPVSATTEFRFENGNRERVTLTVYDMLGRVVSRLFDQVTDAGAHSLEFNARGLISGVYRVRLETASGASITRSMAVVR
jgi:hypothetical protein